MVNLSHDLVKIIASGIDTQFRHQTTVLSEMQIFDAVTKICGTYGGQSDVDKSILSESAELVMRMFSHLSAPEIIEAWRMSVSGMLNVDSTLYGGVFSVDRLGKVLAAYNEQLRKKTHAALEQSKHEEEIRTRQERKAGNDARRKYDADTLHLIEKARSEGKYRNDWTLIMFFWYDVLDRLGKISLSRDDKYRLLDEAKVKLKAHYEKMRDLSAATGDMTEARNYAELLEKEFEPEGETERMAFYAKKLAVYEWLYPDEK